MEDEEGDKEEEEEGKKVREGLKRGRGGGK